MCCGLATGRIFILFDKLWVRGSKKFQQDTNPERISDGENPPEIMAHTTGERLEGDAGTVLPEESGGPAVCREDVAYTQHSGCKRRGQEGAGANSTLPHSWWSVEPGVGRVANGVSSRVDRLRALGNAVVPQQVYPILKAIADYEASLS
jgi:hypothetical protein